MCSFTNISEIKCRDMATQLSSIRRIKKLSSSAYSVIAIVKSDCATRFTIACRSSSWKVCQSPFQSCEWLHTSIWQTLKISDRQSLSVWKSILCFINHNWIIAILCMYKLSKFRKVLLKNVKACLMKTIQGNQASICGGIVYRPKDHFSLQERSFETWLDLAFGWNNGWLQVHRPKRKASCCTTLFLIPSSGLVLCESLYHADAIMERGRQNPVLYTLRE